MDYLEFLNLFVMLILNMKLYAYIVFHDGVSDKIVINYKICFNIEKKKKQKK